MTQPSSGVLRVAFAITKADASNPTADVVTPIIPQTRILTGIQGYAVGGKPGFVGSAGLEAKITDAKTGKICVLAFDRSGAPKT